MSTTPDGMITAEKFSELKGIPLSKTIDMIRSGFYRGKKVDDNWFVDSSEPTKPSSKQKKNKNIDALVDEVEPRKVAITDIKIPFMSMAIFMAKGAIAAIPAILIINFIYWLFTRVLGIL